MFFLRNTYDTIDHSQYVSHENIDEFQGPIGQLPRNFSDLRSLHFILLIRRILKCLPVLGCLDLSRFWLIKF